MSLSLMGRFFASRYFFSSRRRHTRLQGDWSSDVCSSDLATSPTRGPRPTKASPPSPSPAPSGATTSRLSVVEERSEERRVGREGGALRALDQGGKLEQTERREQYKRLPKSFSAAHD